MNKNKIRILLLENIHPVAKEILDEAGFVVEMQKDAFSEEDLLKHLPNYDVLGIRSKTHVSEKVLQKNTHLYTIGAFCIGTNQIECAAANKVGVPVFNAPYSNTRSVAEMVICEIIGLARKLFTSSAKLHVGAWEKSASSSYEVRGKRLGIIGYGHIGTQVSVLAESLGMKVAYYDITKKLPLGNSRTIATLEELLSNSDFVSIHVPETEQTKNMIGAKELSLMHAKSYLINASRGTVVDIEALSRALKEKRIAGAAIDVFPVEPSSNKEVFKSPLQGIDNVILTPHIGGSTEEAQEAIGREVADSFVRFLNRGSSLGAVNFPNVDLPVNGKTHRILNVHRNVPGVLSEINKIVSSLGINISAQYLSTNNEIGYLVMDVDKADAQGFSDQIAKLPTSIKTRVVI
jgi:D-3-phosphoglycerate dehydrogenase